MTVTATLREDIIKARIRTVDSRYLVSAFHLQSLSDDDIGAAMDEQHYPRHRRKEIFELVQGGGKKVFAILLVTQKLPLLINFIDCDQLQSTQLDGKLPFERETLSRIIPEGFEEFYKWQWEFCAPIFGDRRFHRAFWDDTVMPFVDELRVQKSPFGKIHKTTILSSHLRGHEEESPTKV
jgi:hypothetical protein